MDEKKEFLEKLSGLLQLAQGQGNEIAIEEVKAYFSEDALTEEQVELVFEYLMAQKVSVKGYVKLGSEEKQEEFTEEEKHYLKEYEHELEAIPGEKEGEKEDLVTRVLQGDENAKARLIELYMGQVVQVAKQMHQPEVFLGDLIQEGNLGVVLGVGMLADLKTADEVICGQIRQSMQLLLDEQAELLSRDKKMVEKVQALDESIQTLTEELGRKVTIDELAVYMGLEVEEIEDILKLAGEDTEEEAE